jgi:hypothetical protein
LVHNKSNNFKSKFYKIMARQTKRLDEHIVALSRVQKRKITEISKEADILRSNIVNAMAGDRGLPEEKYVRLLDTLGLVSGALDTERIHYWSAGYSLDHLKTVVSYYFPHGAEIAGIWSKGKTFFDLERALERLQYVIYDHRTIVILLRTNFGVLAPGAEPITPETVPGLVWRGGKVGPDTMINLPKQMMQSISSSQLQDVSAIRALMGCDISVNTWEQLISRIQSRWPNANAAYEAIKGALDS